MGTDGSDPSRRRLLQASGGAVTFALAGCGSGGKQPETDAGGGGTGGDGGDRDETATTERSPVETEGSRKFDGPAVPGEYVENFFGACHGDTLLDWFNEVNATWARWDTRWQSVERERDQYDWEGADETFGEDRLEEHGLDVLAILDYTAAWAADGDGTHHPPKESEIDEWKEFVEKIVQRYDHIEYWEVWNEPNVDKFLVTDDQLPVYVERILKPAAEVLHEHDKTVVAPAISHFSGRTLQHGIDLVDEWMGHDNAVEHVDILSLHYTHGDIDISAHENKIPMYDHIYEEYIEPGRLEGVWVSEGGMLGKPWEEAPWAQWVPRYLVPLLYWSIEHEWGDRDQYKHFWYHMATSGGFEPKKLLQKADDGSLELRPVGKAFKTLTSTLGGSETVGTFPGDVSIQHNEDGDDPGGSKSATVVDAETPAETVPAAERPGLIGRSDVASARRVPRTESGDVDWDALAGDPTMHIPGNEEDVVVLGTATGENTVDVTADVSLAYDDEALYFAADVTDDQHHAMAGKGMWQADCIQLAGAADGYGPEIGFSHADGESHVVRWRAGQARAGPEAIDLETSREGEVTTYRARIPWTALYPETPSAGDAVPFSFLINEADGGGRIGWVEWTPGIGQAKSADPLGTVQLASDETDWRAWLAAPLTTPEQAETTLSLVVANDAEESRTVDVTMDALGVEAAGIEVPASATVQKPITVSFSGIGDHDVAATVTSSDGSSTTVENRLQVTANCANHPERYPTSFTTYGFTLNDDVFATAWYQWSDRCAPDFPIEPTVELEGLSPEEVAGVTAIDHETGERTDVPDATVSTDGDTLRLEGVEMDAPVLYLLIETA